MGKYKIISVRKPIYVDIKKDFDRLLTNLFPIREEINKYDVATMVYNSLTKGKAERYKAENWKRILLETIKDLKFPDRREEVVETKSKFVAEKAYRANINNSDWLIADIVAIQTITTTWNCKTSMVRRTKETQSKNIEKHGKSYVRYFLTPKKQIVKENTGREIFLINVYENGALINPRTIMHVGRVVHYELGIKDYDFHSLRHTHATDLHNAGASMLDIKERLGHCNLKTTQDYLHNNEILKQRTKNILNQMYCKQSGDALEKTTGKIIYFKNAKGL